MTKRTMDAEIFFPHESMEKRPNAEIFYPEPVYQPDVHSSLTQIGHDMATIREHLMKKPRKLTMSDLNDKLDIILKILMKEQ